MRHLRLPADPMIALAVTLVALTLWRFLAAWDAALELSVDEAQYFLWSLNPAWGYYSKPPMIAWTIATARTLCGESELCIRAPALVLFALTSGLIALIGKQLFNERIAFSSALAFATLFLTSFYSWAMTTDSLLLFFWTAALYGFLRAITRNAWRDWMVTGVAVGLGLLSKYTMSLFLLCAFAVLLIDHRRLLSSPRPWCAALVALLFLAPNLAWNAQHGFATLRHTAEISQLDRQLFRPASLLAFLLAQFGVMGPLMFPAFLGAASDKTVWRDARLRLCVLFSLPVLVLFVTLAFLTRAHANWAAPAYVGATLLAVAWLLQHARKRWYVAAIALNLLLAGGLYHWHRLAPALGMPLSAETDPFHKLRGWKEAGRHLAAQMQTAGCHAVATADRGSLVALAYYARRALGAPVAAYAYNPDGRVQNHFELTADLGKSVFSCALLIGSHDPMRLTGEFAKVEPLPPLPLPTGAAPVWRVEGFLGYRP
ncbi:MAG: glycosyltransferase family 39 protein [Rhodocyclaceae bacterium]|nr:glycosyltransferase family 39 protein [Rhodocyclaceae bacterium]